MGTAFMRAAPQQGYLKFTMFGSPGSGKTFTSLLWAEGLAKASGKKIAFVDTERGSDPYAIANKHRKIHPEAFEFDALYTTSLAETLEAVKAVDPAEYAVVIVDSITHIWQAAIDAYSGPMVGSAGDKIPMQAWGPIKKPYKELIDLLAKHGQYHGFILGRQKNIFEDEDGSLRKTGVGLKAEGETQYEPMTCVQMSMTPDGVNTCFSDKDRWSVLSGRTIANPNFATIEPMLALLGIEHQTGEDEEERIAKDAALLEEKANKAAAKTEKSKALYEEFQAAILASTSLVELGAARAAASKKKTSLVMDHKNALRLLIESKKDSLANSAVGEMSN